MKHMTEQEYARLQAAWQECEDYIAASGAMRERQVTMQERAYRGSEYARGWLACIHDWATELLGTMNRRRNGP